MQESGEFKGFRVSKVPVQLGFRVLELRADELLSHRWPACHQPGLISTLLRNTGNYFTTFLSRFWSWRKLWSLLFQRMDQYFWPELWMACTIQIILGICSGAALSKFPEGPVVLGGGLLGGDWGRSALLQLKGVRKRVGENLFGIWTMYSRMDLCHLEEETLGFYLLLSWVILFYVVYYASDRTKSKKPSYRAVTYNWHNLACCKP